MYPKKFTNDKGATATAQDAVQEKFLQSQGYYEASAQGTTVVVPTPAPVGKVPGMFSFVVFHHTPSAHLGLTESPAIVHTVKPDGSLLMFVFGTGGVRVEDNVKQGTEPGQWSWPV